MNRKQNSCSEINQGQKCRGEFIVECDTTVEGFEAVDEEAKNGYTQWSIQGDKFFPVGKSVEQLKSGYYSVGVDGHGNPFLHKMKVNLNELFILPNSIHNTVFEEIRTFWDSKSKYQEYGEVYRCNILIHSEPGTGKSSLINLLVDELVKKQNGFVISLNHESDIYNYQTIMRAIREIEPDRQIITIIEDIDNFIGKMDRSLETALLNILDGLLQFDNVVTIATTNNPEDITERYTNRPTRFGLVIEYPLPDAETRKFFIEKKVRPEDLKTIDIDEWVRNTECYTTDHLNNVIKLVFVMGLSPERAFERMNAMVNRRGPVKNQSKGKNNGSIGFSSK